MEPELIMGGNTAKIVSIWYENMYADILWISLLQYVGDNLPNNAYLSFLSRLEQTILSLNPDFEKMYEWGLLLLPIPRDNELTYSDEQKQRVQIPLSLALSGIDRFCDPQKRAIIWQTPLSQALWENPDLKNPCTNGMLPYYIAFYGGTLLGNQEIAHTYYTLAGMHDQVPQASQILAILSTAPKDNFQNIALNFALMAVGGNDREPYTCTTLAQRVLTTLDTGEYIQKKTIEEIMSQEKNLIPLPESSESAGVNNCYNMLERAIKYTSLAFIDANTKDHPEIASPEELRESGIVDTLPIPQMQNGTTLRKINNQWRYAP